MKSVTYYVCTCKTCNSISLVKVDFLQFNDKCCLEFKNLKILRQFNDEREARNYMELYNQNEEKED